MPEGRRPAVDRWCLGAHSQHFPQLVTCDPGNTRGKAPSRTQPVAAHAGYSKGCIRVSFRDEYPTRMRRSDIRRAVPRRGRIGGPVRVVAIKVAIIEIRIQIGYLLLKRPRSPLERVRRAVNVSTWRSPAGVLGTLGKCIVYRWCASLLVVLRINDQYRGSSGS